MAETTSNDPGRESRGWKRYGWHALLLAILAGECLAAILLHRSDKELQAVLDDGSGQAQVAALAVLTNRGDPESLDPGSVRELLRSDNVLIREWTMTTNFARLAPPRVLLKHANSTNDANERYRSKFLLKYALGRRNSMRLAELARFLDAETASP